MTQIIGLHTCQVKYTPKVGEVKTFLVYEETSRAGKQYTKIRKPDTKKGEQGQNYKVFAVEKTDYTDQYGNVSFNLTIEPSQDAPATHQEPRQSASNNETHQDSARQHIMRAANLYNLCADAVNAVIYPKGTDVSDELWMAAQGQLFKEVASRRTNDGVNWFSYIDQMPDKPIKKEQPEPEPYRREEEEEVPF